MVAEGNVGLAFAMVAGAGLATTVGACIVWCASIAQPRFLAASLGFAAGVMLYVSFAEIFMRKSVAAFESAALDGAAAYRWSTLCLFGGMLAIVALDKIVHALAHYGAQRAQRKAGGGSASASTANLLTQEEQRAAQSGSGSGDGTCGGHPSAAATAPGAPPPIPPMRRLQQAGPGGGGGGGSRRDVEASGSAASTPRAGADAAARPLPDDASETSRSSGSLQGDPGLGSLQPAEARLAEPCDAMTTCVVAASCPETLADGAGEGEGGGGGGGAAATTSRTPPAVVELLEADHHAFLLKKMGLLTALALFIHNFPEGLATFVGALADTKVGVGLAVAIAMHNVPEGICVAMPIYYATGSKWKGFWWAFLSGVSEPVGGLVGYLALNGNTDLSFAIVFGLVAGMMVYISVKELIPTALRYDPQDRVATTCVVAGMVVMAASLLLFTL